MLIRRLGEAHTPPPPTPVNSMTRCILESAPCNGLFATGLSPLNRRHVFAAALTSVEPMELGRLGGQGSLGSAWFRLLTVAYTLDGF